MKKETRTQLTNLGNIMRATYGEYAEVEKSEGNYIFNIPINNGQRGIIQIPIDKYDKPIGYFREIEKCRDNNAFAKITKISNHEKTIKDLLLEHNCKNLYIAFNSFWDSQQNIYFNINYIRRINKINEFTYSFIEEDEEYIVNFKDDSMTWKSLNGWDIEGLENKLHYINQLNANEYNSPVRYHIINNELLELDYEDNTFVVMIDDLDNIKCFDNSENEDDTLNEEELIIEFYTSDNEEMCYFIEANNLCCC